MNDPLDERMRKETPIGFFFYKPLTVKRPNSKTDSYSDLFIWELKYYSATAFFELMRKKHEFISWVTQYYPFSLLYRDKWTHVDHKPAREFVIKLEDAARKGRQDIAIIDGQAEGDGMEFYGYFNGLIKDKDKRLKTLEKVLQKEFGSIYVRDHETGFRILIPTELLWGEE